MLYFISSLAIAAKCILLEFAAIMPSFALCSSVASYFCKNYSRKIDSFLGVHVVT